LNPTKSNLATGYRAWLHKEDHKIEFYSSQNNFMLSTCKQVTDCYYYFLFKGKLRFGQQGFDSYQVQW